jgi:hypothetical protein
VTDAGFPQLALAAIPFGWLGALILGGTVALTAIVIAVALWRTKTRPPMSAPKGWGTHPDDRQWEDEAAKAPHEELASVRESAKSWAASLTALLGVGGTVAFVKGEEAFAKLSHSTGNVVFWLTVTAAAMAGLSIVTATFAAQDAPARYKGLDGWTLRTASRDLAQAAMRKLYVSRVLGLVAAVAILAVAGISWQASIAKEIEPTGNTAYAVTTDGRLRCGELSTSSLGGVSIATGKGTKQVAGKVEPVDKCPARAGSGP